MKTNFLTLTFLISALFLTACKQEATLAEYKHADKPDLACQGSNSPLLKEALYAFEDDLINFYDKDKKNLNTAYRKFLPSATRGRVDFIQIASPRTQEVFNALKAQSNLWNLGNEKSNSNYDNAVFACIGKNMQTEDLKKTYNALTSTGSMSSKLFGVPLATNSRTLVTDKYLALYVALDLYYAKLHDVDFSAKTTTPTNNPVKKEENDPHAGHNH